MQIQSSAGNKDVLRLSIPYMFSTWISLKSVEKKLLVFAENQQLYPMRLNEVRLFSYENGILIDEWILKGVEIDSNQLKYSELKCLTSFNDEINI